MSTRDLALQALVATHVRDRAIAIREERRAALGDEMANGDRVGVTAPGEPDAEVGLMYRTKPKATAAVTDRAVFTAWMAKHYPDNVESTARLTGESNREQGYDLELLVRQSANPAEVPVLLLQVDEQSTKTVYAHSGHRTELVVYRLPDLAVAP